MKRLLLLAAIFIAGCTSQQSDQLTQQQKDQIKNEVKAVADSIWAKWEELDPEGALPYYSDSPDWMSFNSQGTRYNFQTYKKLATNFKNSATAYKWTTIRQDFIFVTKDIVMCAWIGKDEAFWKSGDKMTCDPHAYTLVFKKIAGRWKLLYSHDSGIAVTQEAGKK
jgi:hypothetical protein